MPADHRTLIRGQHGASPFVPSSHRPEAPVAAVPTFAVAAAKRCPGGNLAASCMKAFDELASVTFCDHGFRCSTISFIVACNTSRLSNAGCRD